MTPDDYARLKQKLEDAIVQRGPGVRVAIVGWSTVALDLAVLPAFTTGAASLVGLFAPQPGGIVRHLGSLKESLCDVLVIAEDAGKEALLEAVADLVSPMTNIVIGGYAHLEFSDAIFVSAGVKVTHPAG